MPLVAHAQERERVRRVGVLANVTENDAEMQVSLKVFQQELERLGWSEGRNVRVDIRFTQADLARHPALAKEMVAQQPDVILVHTTPVVTAVQKDAE
jgi:putative ABC transport system substrate-binding protein